MNNKFYLTTPIYYVNAKPHIGHAYTTLSADVIARYQKQKIGEENVFFLTGTDEHGANIAAAAERAKKPVSIFCDEIALEFRKTWAALDIQYSDFIRTTSDRHKTGAQSFLFKLKENRALYKGEYEGLYCSGCESFITEKDLNEKGQCPAHLKPPEKLKEKNWFFKLKQFLPQIKTIIESDKLKVEPNHIKTEVIGLLKQKLTDFSVSREKVKWGIPLPWDKNQTIYVWVEALTNYLTARGYPKLAPDNWPADLHLIGKDIIKFHCIYWPALLLSAGLELPNKIFAHGFFTINGQKMSKTLGNVLDPNNLVNQYGVDGARYLILSQFPFGQDGDIEEGRFKEKYNADLANGLGNLVARVTSLCRKQITDWDKFWKQVKNKQKFQVPSSKFQELMDNLQLFEALRLTMNKVNETDEYLTGQQPWAMDKVKNQEKIQEVLTDAVFAVLQIAEQIKPFLPQTSQSILEKVNLSRKKIEQGKPLFPRR